MFSVIIPYFNKAKYIKRCINSVLNQSITNYEIIIIDDGSTDEGLAFLADINSDKIVLISQLNKGVSEARNIGIKTAKNKFIAFLDADDCWHTSYLEKVKQLIDIDNNVKIIGCNYSRDKVFLIKEINDIDYYKFDNYFKIAIKNTFFTSSSTVIESSFFKQNNGFNSLLKSGEDSDVWFRAVANGGNAYYIKNTLVYYSNEDENQATKIKHNIENTLVGNINGMYNDTLKTLNNKNFSKFVSMYVYFNLYPYYFDKLYNKEAKMVLEQNKFHFFWLHLVYWMPVSIGKKILQSNNYNNLIRLYLKFCIRYIYT
ncbi:glycosyltransferase family A protein [Flavobacterium sp. SUN052]|uniref:glycosyltransferase family 2 protein n=1 Tax=Flavobacterium sp. SUN052 TaxID=3002441 RepID=UPI00237E1870|nr:glycosyltransferase family A protein [Flavobacterium sp. SUN052]MEC4005489.1 glycosyltransferase family A protein [Flavobacterium sp. SUN052]